MVDGYRDDREALLVQVDLLRRENRQLRDTLEEHSAAAIARKRSEAISPSMLAVALSSIFFLGGAIIYASAVVGLHGTHKAMETAAAINTSAAVFDGTQVFEPSAPTSPTGTLRVIIDHEAKVQIDDAEINRVGNDPAFVSAPLRTDQPHRVHVIPKDPSLREYDQAVEVNPGARYTVYVWLSQPSMPR